MKFSLFAHMERLGTDQDQHALYDEFMALCQLADDNGFEAVWTGEHHGMDFTIAPNPLTTLVDIADAHATCGLVQRRLWHLSGTPSSWLGRLRWQT